MWFNNKKAFIPVLHLTRKTNVLKNVEILNKCGINNIFLISHSNLDHLELINEAKKIKEKYPDFWVGCNFLNLEPLNTFNRIEAYNSNIDAVWIDNSFAGLSTERSKSIKSNKENTGFKGLYFGGVAFKYCQQPFSLEFAIKEGLENIDIITTTGPGTGEEIDMNKLKTFYLEINKSKPLALASGVTDLNIDTFLKYVDIFIVGTFIENENGDFIEENILLLKERIKNYKEVV